MELFIDTFAEWAWGSSPSDDVTPSICTENFPLMTSSCFTALVAKGIGIGIILGACLNKLPVILNIMKSDSVAGLSLGAVYGDALMYSNAMFYGILQKNPFTSWGENGVVTLQSVFICTLVWKLKDDPAVTIQQQCMAVAVYAAYAGTAFAALPEEYHYLLQAVNWPVLLYSRGMAIVDIVRLGHTGSQSIITHAMNLAGSSIRIVTTITEIGWDWTLLQGYGMSAFLNVILVCQCIYYRKNTREFLEGLEKKKE